MKCLSIAGLFVLLCTAVTSEACGGPNETVFTFRGTSDASATVALGRDKFIMADDEDNILRVYKLGGGSAPIYSYDTTAFLRITAEHPEADIEGATVVGNRIYWITSHGRNRRGQMRPNRYRFFAASVRVEGGSISIEPVGRPYRWLAHELVTAEHLSQLGLGRATRFSANGLGRKELAKLAPKREGLNIEGLCASPDGGTIWIGFRNPRPPLGAGGIPQALVVPLKNAALVVERAHRPVFGKPLLWDLGGLGIRSMEHSRYHQAYFILAGPHNGQSRFALYRWSGQRDKQPVLVRQIDTAETEFVPEALAVFDGSESLWLLSDDGSLTIDVASASECVEGQLLQDGRCQNKHLTDPNKQSFRGMWLKP